MSNIVQPTAACDTTIAQYGTTLCTTFLYVVQPLRNIVQPLHCMVQHRETFFSLL